MCLSTSNVHGGAMPWNWGGDQIVFNSIIPASRKISGTKKRYDIDIREFISNADNAVIKKTIDQIAVAMPMDKRLLFMSHKKGSFDFRVRAITAYISEHINYKYIQKNHYEWLFPEETIAMRSGNCDDRAFLLASLLISSGISNYVVRVALGKLYNQRTRESYDHAWVMYKNESGIWMLIEPLLHSPAARKHEKEVLSKPVQKVDTDAFEYIPYYVFNNAHLWRVNNNTVDTHFMEYLESRVFWEEFTPEFAAGVHDSIFDEAFADSDLSGDDIHYIKAVSLALDINPAIYDPRDHFDNGYIDESWQIIDQKLATGEFNEFAHICHTVGDFYAHTSYMHFAVDKNAFYDRTNSNLEAPNYTSGEFDLTTDKFTANTSKCTDRTETIDQNWQGRLISGRFAQPADPFQGALEKLFIYIPYELRTRPDFQMRTCLPHHNEIAVDDDKKRPDSQRLYDDPTYQEQFKLRKAAAIAHIRKIYADWKQSTKGETYRDHPRPIP